MRAATRTVSFFTTWIAEIVRQPWLVLLLIVGPFAILVAFGQGINVTEIKPEVILVRSGDTDEAIQPLTDELEEYVDIVEETDDLTAAIRRVRNGEVDAVAVVPPDPEGTVREGERIPVQVFTSEIDPLTERFTEAYLVDQVGQLNQQTIARAIREAQGSFGDVQEQVEVAQEYIAIARTARGDIEVVREQIDNAQTVLDPLSEAADALVAAAENVSFVLPGIGVPDDEVRRLRSVVADVTEAVNALDRRLASTGEGGVVPTEEELEAIATNLETVLEAAAELQAIPPDVLSAPFELELDNVAPFEPSFTGFYSPAVLALLVQHLGISLAALSLSRIRILGLTELLQVAPIRAVEIVNGQYLSYGLLVGGVGFAILLSMHELLGVPLFGPYWQVAATIIALALVALGIGFVVSLISTSEQQATQIAMLILLAAVFFGGLLISLERVAWPVKAFSFALPSTYATRALHDVMLRGVLRHPEDLLILTGAALALYALTIVLLRRELRPQ